RKPTPHQKSIAHLRLGRRVGGATRMIEEPHHRLVAAVRNLEQRGAVTTVQIFGPEDVEVGGELDQALFVARSFIKINDDFVVRIARVNGEVDFSDDLLVGSGQSELLAIEEVCAGDDLNPSDASLNR